MPLAWEPSCALEILPLRAEMLRKIRDFFAARKVLEVETPLLGQAIGSDPHLDFFTIPHTSFRKTALFLQTSPEFAMKRLLAAGSGSIFQICKAFREGEAGRLHNPEFTLLEWYRLDYDLPQLMAETADLLLFLLGEPLSLNAVQRFSYAQVFWEYTGLDALCFDLSAYRRCAERHRLPEAAAICGADHALWLDFLFSHLVQPFLGSKAICLIHDYPACQAALARLKPGNPLLAERVEIFVDGLELGNGYHELTDVREQRQRFARDRAARVRLGLPEAAVDERFLAALEAGLPDCAGMAIGLDRVLMLLTGHDEIASILAFPVSRA